jgi:acetyl/propionyl-CoA carboxylase alpha subunit
MGYVHLILLFSEFITSILKLQKFKLKFHVLLSDNRVRMRSLNDVSIGKVLVGNRGIIANRALHALRKLNAVKPDCVLSRRERSAPWLLQTDLFERYHEVRGYSHVADLVELARSKNVKAEAFYPGYGFLSENPEAARAFEGAGITWIGPRPETLDLFGDKMASRDLAQRCGVNVIHGGRFESIEEGLTLALNIIRQKKAEAIAKQDNIPVKRALKIIGVISPEDWKQCPVRVKSVASGGGRAQAVIDDPGDFKAKVESVRSEAFRRTSNDVVFLERHIARTRHIEVQLIGDGENVRHFGCRNCTIQVPGKHQKLIEEAIHPNQSDLSKEEKKLIEDLIASALKIGKAVGLRGVATVEFLIDEDRNYFFLEVNPRIQVEVDPTETISSIRQGTWDNYYYRWLNLVEEQFKIAFGSDIFYEQEDIAFDGSAIEARIYSMDPATLYPYFSTITDYRPPKAVPRLVKVEDGGLSFAFGALPHQPRRLIDDYQMTDYDPMFGKITVWGGTRREAIDRLTESVKQFHIRGDVKTLNPLVLSILQSEKFMEGNGRIFTDFAKGFL